MQVLLVFSFLVRFFFSQNATISSICFFAELIMMLLTKKKWKQPNVCNELDSPQLDLSSSKGMVEHSIKHRIMVKMIALGISKCATFLLSIQEKHLPQKKKNLQEKQRKLSLDESKLSFNDCSKCNINQMKE